MEQVKGVSYSLPTFLGPQTWNQNNNNYGAQPIVADKQEYCSSLLKNKDNALFHCVIYLAPGDYHRFHSPVQWNVQFRRHFAGELLSVNPVVARWIAGLFSLNERAVYVGEWEHGFFSYTAVGATNVGSIRVYEDMVRFQIIFNLLYAHLVIPNQNKLSVSFPGTHNKLLGPKKEHFPRQKI